MGAVWSESVPAGKKSRHAGATQSAELHGGHFPLSSAPLTPAKNVASTLLPWPAWLLTSPLRFKEGQP
jgi:hypothetical protein